MQGVEVKLFPSRKEHHADEDFTFHCLPDSHFQTQKPRVIPAALQAFQQLSGVEKKKKDDTCTTTINPKAPSMGFFSQV